MYVVFVASGILFTEPATHAYGFGLKSIQFRTIESSLSPAYMCQHNCNCLKLLKHWILLAFSLARASAGNSKAARMAIMAMTTSSSIRVNPAYSGARSEERRV